VEELLGCCKYPEIFVSLSQALFLESQKSFGAKPEE
jgi:hypothetical protein